MYIKSISIVIILFTLSFQINAQDYLFGFRKFEENGKIGIDSIGGKIIVPAIYDELEDIYDIETFSLTLYKMKGKYGIMKKYKPITNNIYDSIIIHQFNLSREKNIICIVKLNNKWGLISTLTNFEIKPKYDNIQLCNKHFDGNQYFFVKENNYWKMIDSNENNILNEKFDSITPGYFEGYGNHQVISHTFQKNGKWGGIGYKYDSINNKKTYKILFKNRFDKPIYFSENQNHQKNSINNKKVSIHVDGEIIYLD